MLALLFDPKVIALAAIVVACIDALKKRFPKLDGWPGIPLAALFSGALVSIETQPAELGAVVPMASAVFVYAVVGHQLIAMLRPRSVVPLVEETKPPAPSGPLASIGLVILACLALAVLGVGCGLSTRHVVAESALGVTDGLEKAEPKIREQCILPYAYALKVDDRASMKAIDAECKPKVAVYDGARASVVAARLALALNDIEALKRLVPELLAAGQRLLALIGGGR